MTRAGDCNHRITLNLRQIFFAHILIHSMNYKHSFFNED